MGPLTPIQLRWGYVVVGRATRGADEKDVAAKIAAAQRDVEKAASDEVTAEANLVGYSIGDWGQHHPPL